MTSALGNENKSCSKCTVGKMVLVTSSTALEQEPILEVDYDRLLEMLPSRNVSKVSPGDAIVSNKEEDGNSVASADETDQDVFCEYVCTSCKAHFLSAKECNVHPCVSVPLKQRRRGRKATNCASCKKNFARPIQLRLHMAFCHPLVIYECQLCQKGFPNKHLLRAHVRSHTGEKPYPCKICGRPFTSSALLWTHKKFTHLEEALDCLECGHKFPTSQMLHNHIRIKHTLDRALQCKICDQKFLNSSVLYQHQLCHSGIKNYKCGHCPKTFRRLQTQQNHERIHTNERPFPCPFCPHTFRQKGDVKTHCSRQHPSAAATDKSSQ